jgi:hypothetical protein
MAKLARLERSATKLSVAGTLYFRMADSGNFLFRANLNVGPLPVLS